MISYNRDHNNNNSNNNKNTDNTINVQNKLHLDYSNKQYFLPAMTTG